MINKPTRQAALDGAIEISGPDTSGTFTTLAAFLPLLVISGLAALFLRPFGWTVGAALLVSLILSLIMVPALSATPWFSSQEGNEQHPGNRFMQRLNNLVRRGIDWGMQHRTTVILGSISVVLLAAVLAVVGRASMLPPLDEGSILIEYTMPPGTSLAESDRIGNKLESIALGQADVASVYRRTGSPISGYQIEGVNRGEMMIKLTPLKLRKHSATETMRYFRHLYAPFLGMTFLFHQPTQEKMDESFSGLPALFGVTIFGEDEGRLIDLAGRIEALLGKNPNISNIVNNTKVRSSQMTARIRPGVLAQYGLTPEDVMQVIRAAGLGVQAGQVVRAQETFPILLQWQGADIRHPDEVGQLPVPTPNGEWIPLNRLADIESSAVAASVTRLNGQRQITLLAEARGNLMSVARSIQAQLDQLEMPKGYSASVSGQYPVLMHTVFEFGLTALAAIALIYLIMVLQFGSWKQPLAILLAIPVAVAGGMIAVRGLGFGIDVSIGMGALTLIGIAVNNGIVLVDFANRGLTKGLSPTDAWKQAIRVRLRPVVMTAATTIASLLPIALGLGGVSEIFRPFAIMVIGGLLAAMVGTLILLSVLIGKDKQAISH